MLMMLCVGAASGKKSGPADVHDAERGCGLWQKRGPADAHDAGHGRQKG